jgi:CIC family chloride channel protein
LTPSHLIDIGCISRNFYPVTIVEERRPPARIESMRQTLSKRFSGFKLLKTREHSIIAILAVIVGIGSGMGVVGFRYLIGLFQSVAYGSSDTLFDVVTSIPWFVRIAVPAVGGLVIGPLIYYFAKEAKGYGVPEVMEAVALRSGFIRKRVLVVKSLASAICIGTGGSAGSVGPVVQIGSAVGSFLGQVLKISVDRMRTLVGCGAAASIAAIFDAPLAGSMFAIEIMLGDFGVATFGPIIISSVTATAVSRCFFTNSPVVAIPFFEWVSAWELPLYALLGAVCALTAFCFIKILHATEDFFNYLRLPEYLKAGLGGLCVGLLSLLCPQILGVGFDAAELALHHQLPWMLMLTLLFLKIAATSLSLGSGGSGGIFAPCLFMGTMAGGFFGAVVHHFLTGVTASTSAYGTLGMAAVVGAAIHGPYTAILMLFEMTGETVILLPGAVACITSSFVIGKLATESIYTLKLLRRGIDLREGREVNLLKSIPVRDVMNQKVETVPERMTLSEILRKVSTCKHNNFPVVDRRGNPTGVLFYDDYRDAIVDGNIDDTVTAGDLAARMKTVITMENNLYDALDLMNHQDISILPIVASKENHELKGILTHEDIISAYKVSARKRSLFSNHPWKKTD